MITVDRRIIDSAEDGDLVAMVEIARVAGRANLKVQYCVRSQYTTDSGVHSTQRRAFCGPDRLPEKLTKAIRSVIAMRGSCGLPVYIELNVGTFHIEFRDRGSHHVHVLDKGCLRVEMSAVAVADHVAAATAYLKARKEEREREREEALRLNLLKTRAQALRENIRYFAGRDHIRLTAKDPNGGEVNRFFWPDYKANAVEAARSLADIWGRDAVTLRRVSGRK